MKKIYIYFVPPLIALALFGVYYWHFDADYTAEQTRIAAANKEKVLQKQKDDYAKSKEAYDVGVAATNKVKAERVAQEQKSKDDAKARADAVDVRDKALHDAHDKENTESQKYKQIEDLKQGISDMEDRKKELVDEQASLAKFVQTAQANVAGLDAQLQQLKDADAAWIKKQADDAAAAAAKAKK